MLALTVDGLYKEEAVVRPGERWATEEPFPELVECLVLGDREIGLERDVPVHALRRNAAIRRAHCERVARG